MIAWLVLVVPAEVRSQEFSIRQDELVAQRRIGRTEFEYEFRARLYNDRYPPYGCPASSVVAKLEPWVPPNAGVTILDGDLHFGRVASGESVVSQDTFTVRINRALASRPELFSWEIIPLYEFVEAPTLSIVTPADGSHTEAGTVVIEGAVSAGANVTIDVVSDSPNPAATGVIATVAGSSFSGAIALAPGLNMIKVSAYPGPCGLASFATLTVFRDPPSQNDLSVSMSASADTASVGDDLTYTVRVQNRGPLESSNVVLTDFLPANVFYVAGAASQGVVEENDGVVTINLGRLAGESSATVTLSVQVHGDSLLNRATLSRAEPETYLANNTAVLATQVASFHSFRVDDLRATSSQVVSHESLAFSNGPDSRGEIAPGDMAISPEWLFLTGSSASEGFELDELVFGWRNPPGFGTVSDLRSGGVWRLGNAGTALRSRAGGVVTQLLPLSSQGLQLFGKILAEYPVRDEFFDPFPSPFLPPLVQERVSSIGRGWDDRFSFSPVRFRVKLRPPVTGNYIFWLAGWQGELLLSSDEEVENLQSVPISGGIHYPTGFGLPGASAPIALVADRLYYLEVRAPWPGLADPSLVVEWSKPGEDPVYHQPIPPEVLEPVPAPDLDRQGETLQLSRQITLGNANGVFAGYGRLVLNNGERVFNVDLSSGLVTDLGPMTLPPHRVQHDGWFWGVAENEGDTVSLVYVKDSQTVVRTRVPDGQTSVISTFSDLGQMAVIGAAPKWQKWAFASETKTQFDEAVEEPVGMADAAFSITSPQAVDDLSVSVAPANLPATVAGGTAVVITVSNAGPTPATGVKLTDAMDGTISLQSVEASQGTYHPSAGQIEFALGDIAGGASVSVTIRYVPQEAGRVVHFATVTRNEPDLYLPNNQERCTVPVTLPTLRVSQDVHAMEGDSGSTEVLFRVSLSRPMTIPVTVKYSTSNIGEAQGVPYGGSDPDFISAFGELTLAPGETFKEVPVTVIGDTLHEADERFVFDLDSPVGARISNGRGYGTILNDDPAPEITVTGLAGDEGNDGLWNSLALFELILSRPSEAPVSVGYTISDGTAVSPDDYASTSWRVEFAPHQTVKRILVSVRGDTLIEPDETVQITLFDPSYASLANSRATGVIRNDDVALAAGNTAREGVCLEFQSRAGIRYRIEMAESVSGEWNPVDRLAGTGGLLKWRPAVVPEHSCFYRVVRE